MARPREPVSDYRVAIHKIREYRYAATQPLYHKENGTLARKYIHCGQVDERLVFNPNELWKTLTQDERAKFIFSEGWSINTCAENNAKQNNGISLPKAQSYGLVTEVSGQYNNKLYGAVWLLEKIAENCKIKEDLLSVINNSEELYSEILTLSIFPCLTNRNYDRVARWQHYTKVPALQSLTSSYITKLTQRVNDNHRMQFLKVRLKRQEGQNPWNRGGNNRPMTFSHANRVCANDLFFAMRMIVEYFQKSVADIQEKTKIPTVIKATPLD